MTRLQFSALLLVAVLAAGCGLLPFGAGGKLPVQESAAWTRVLLNPDQGVDAPGIYLREMSSGKTEGWQVVAEAGALRAATFPSDDLVVAHTEAKWYIINRTTGKVYEWDYATVALVAASSSRLLFQELATGRLFVTDGDLKVQRSVKAPEGVTAVVGAMSADGKTAAFLPASGGPVYLMELSTGKLTETAAAPQGGWLFSMPDGKAFFVGYQPAPGDRTVLLHRFAWDGRKLGEFSVPGTNCAFTRDGMRVACTGGAWPGQVQVSDVETGVPLYRVLGAMGGAWTADGAQLVVGLEGKPEYRMVTADGKVATTAVTKMGAAENPPVPSPAALGTFALRGMVIDGEAKALFTAPVDTAKWQLSWVAPWGKGGAEFRYLVRTPITIDSTHRGWPFEPVVQMAPFSAEVGLEVKAAGGDCLNLRAAAGKEAKVIRCMPSGTKLQPAGAPGAEEARDGERWMQVRTDKGESGWVAITTGDIRYAER
ncbi:MAG: hypothetical protein K0R39_4814 [Symbiobacteriaceae bacterium]|nr:hypothetical protein [Symbiobacteriaceae bacterium]